MKFTNLSGDISHVSKLPDVPTLENGYAPSVLKEVFDRAGEEIKEFINSTLLPELEGEGAAEKLGMSPTALLTSRDLQSGVQELAEKISEIANAQVPSGSISPDKFIPAVASFMTEGSPRYRFFSESGTHTFVPTRSGNYKISVQGAGGGGSCMGVPRIPFGGCSGGASIGWIRLEAGREYTVLVGEGGAGLKIAENGSMLSRALSGGASAFFDGESELLYAGGGEASAYPTAPPETRGGSILMNGNLPLCRKDPASEGDSFEIGAPSYFASSTAYAEIPAGVGAGGYGAKYDFTSTSYSRAGGRGGDGGILIEWME